MPKSIAYEGRIEHWQILDEHGRLDEEMARDTLSDSDVKFLYEQMIMNREYDEQAFKLQRSGRMGTFPQNKGQEAAALGAARAMRKGHDFLVPFYRENPASFLHGLPMHFIYLFWMGDERGNAIPSQYSMTPLCIEIGAQCLHGAGIAWAFQLRKEDRVAVTFLGEGATSTGDFHEGLNFAATYKLPVVYSCMNNGWAISVPTSKQTGSETFAQKALAYGIPGLRIDGNDIFASYKAHRWAIERARKGEGPALIESLTYRLADHTTADDARRYRDNKELESRIKLDPMIRTRKYLESKKLWDDAQQTAAEQKARVIVQEVAKYSLNIEKPNLEDIFNHVFENLPAEIIKQRDTMRTDSIGQNPEQIGLQQKLEAADELR